MASDRIVLVSDVHVDQWPTDLPDAHEEKRIKFLEFFDWVIEGSGAERLVINGDLLDVPQKDREPILPKYSDIADKLRAVVESGIKLGYVIGNHDSGLVGLDIALDDPPVRVGYPNILVRSGNVGVLIEHGHLQDPWLWDYVRHLAANMWARGEEVPDEVWRLGLAPSTAAPIRSPAEQSTDLPRLWQMSADELPLQSPDAQWLVRAAQLDLLEDYEDVTHPDRDREMLEARAELLRELPTWPLSPSFAVAPSTGPSLGEMAEKLVQTLYSGPHWRRVAKHRTRQLSEQLEQPVTRVIMGHTHWPDEFSWTEAETEYHYVNSGSWRRQHADIVVVEGGRMELFKREWDEDWPDLSG